MGLEQRGVVRIGRDDVGEVREPEKSKFQKAVATRLELILL